ncbi:radical SAM protein, partial [Myxococcota bacterium]|nr:radical SAM protein [Myxococcota bacterium]
LTSFPRDFTDEALDVMAASPRICRYLHIPVQSGSNTMLKAMNRGHTIEDYLDLLKRARSRMPDIRLAGDMIVGFSGETEEDHQASIKLLKEARYKGAFIFKYSPREGTTAYKRLEDDVPNDVKKRRNLELLEIQSKIGLENHEALVGQELDVLVETQSKLKIHSESGESKNANPEEIVRLMSRSMGDEIVAFDGPVKLIGTITRVRVTKATALTVAGEWVG